MYATAMYMDKEELKCFRSETICAVFGKRCESVLENRGREVGLERGNVRAKRTPVHCECRGGL